MIAEPSTTWKYAQLSDVARVFVGIASSATHAYVEDDGVPIIRNTNINEGYIDTSELLLVSRNFDEEYVSKRVYTGDVVTVRTGYPGISAVVPSELNACQTFTTIITRPDSKYLDSHFLCAFINSEIGSKLMHEIKIGGAQANIGVGDIEKVKIPLPSLEEQRRIVAVLATWDRAIEQTQRLISLHEERKRGLMEAYWQRCDQSVKLRDIGICIRGVGYRPEQIREYNDSSIALCRANNIQNGKFENHELIYVEAEAVGSIQIMMENDIFICMSNGSKHLVGKACVIDADNSGIYTFGSFCAVYRPNQYHGIIKHFFGSDRYFQLLSSMFSGGNINNLRPDDILSLDLGIPSSEEELNNFLNVLQAADKQLDQLRARLAALRTQKRGLMQQLLTGTVRI